MPVFRNEADTLFVSPSEPYGFETYKAAMNQAVRLCLQNGLHRILADIRSFEGCIPAIDKYELGVHLAQILGSRIKLAILARTCIIDRLGENSAVNRGAQVLVTDDMTQALRWLNKEQE